MKVGYRERVRETLTFNEETTLCFLDAQAVSILQLSLLLFRRNEAAKLQRNADQTATQNTVS